MSESKKDKDNTVFPVARVNTVFPCANTEKETSSNDFLTVSEVAELLRVSDETVYRLCRRGQLKASQVGVQWRIKRSSIDEYLRVPTGEEASKK